MKKIVLASVFLFVFSFTGVALAGIPGALDKTGSATLIVPFFEVGINASQDPLDTLAVVYNMATSDTRIHYHVWDINGNPTDLYGNLELSGNNSWSATMRGLISASTSTVQSALTDGNYYRGFMTIDVVTANTTDDPTEAGYPFATGASTNVLEGFVYFVRLSEGSSNSMSMIPVNWVPATTSGYIRGLYQAVDEREEFDATARACSEHEASGAAGACALDIVIDRVDSRVFLSSALNASTRIILFTWYPGIVGGPSAWCDTHSCDSDYDYKQYDENGNLVTDTTIRLADVVNVINVSGTANGLVSIQGIVDDPHHYHVYGFSITNASPSSGPSANWDAILPSYIEP